MKLLYSAVAIIAVLLFFAGCAQDLTPGDNITNGNMTNRTDNMTGPNITDNRTNMTNITNVTRPNITNVTNISRPNVTNVTRPNITNVTNVTRPNVSINVTNGTGGNVTNDTGRLLITLDVQDMNASNISSVKLTVERIFLPTGLLADQLAPIANGSQEYDLSVLGDTERHLVIADTRLQSGTYDPVRMRLELGAVSVTHTNGTNYSARLPVDQVNLTALLSVLPNETSAITMNLHMGDSLRVNAAGDYVFEPRFDFETRQNVRLGTRDAQGRIEIFGGELITNNTIGGDQGGVVNQNQTGNQTTNQTLQGMGRVLVSLAHVGSNETGADSVKMVVDRIWVRSETGQNWVLASSVPRILDLTELSGVESHAILADMPLPTGTYDQVQVRVSIPAVIVTDEAQNDFAAFLPAREMNFTGTLAVLPNLTSAVIFNVNTADSLHTTARGEYVFAPLIGFETRENVLTGTRDAAGRMEITAGRLISNSTVGVNELGMVGENVTFPTGTVSIVGGSIRVQGVNFTTGNLTTGNVTGNVSTIGNTSANQTNATSNVTSGNTSTVQNTTNRTTTNTTGSNISGGNTSGTGNTTANTSGITGAPGFPY